MCGMLTALTIRNYVLIDELTLTLGAGLTALTGETGAGKSILLDALGLAAGGRAERAALRAGADEGAVSAAFEPDADHAVWPLLEKNGLPGGDQVILRRVQSKDGKSRAFVNDQPLSVALLKEIGETLVEIHGQHDGRGFLSASTHRALLDDFGGLAPARAALSGHWRQWRAAVDDLEARSAGRVKAEAEADYLRHVVATLGRLDPQPDEEAALAARRAELMAAAKAADDLAAAAELLADDGVEAKLISAARRLARAAALFPQTDNPVAAAVARIESALSEAMEAKAALDAATSRLSCEPEALEAAEERLFALRAEARKHGVSVDGLVGLLEKTRATLADLETGEEDFERLARAAADGEAAYAVAAGALSSARQSAARKLDKAVAAELAPLKLARAEFITEIRSDGRPSADGVDDVEFMVRTNPGSPAGPLKSIASGGELARFVLAMKAALAAKENRTVIIFDEVDAGVGGAVADAVGERLARLARDAQVLVVTHSPQVAARAGAHWLIEKRQSAKATSTRVQILDAEARVEEIARMLSGAETTDEARAAAKSLLGVAPRVRLKRKGA